MCDTSDLLVNSICTCLFLDDKISTKIGANILKNFETLVLFEVGQNRSLDTTNDFDWYQHVTECTADIVFDVISMFQTNMFQFKYLLEKHIRVNEVQQLRSRFVGDLSIFTANRKLIKEGEIFLLYTSEDGDEAFDKEKFTYFLFGDLLIIAELNEKSSKYQIIYEFKTDDIKVNYDDSREKQFSVCNIIYHYIDYILFYHLYF